MVDPPGHPIVSSSGSVLQTLAVYVDQFLQPIVKKLLGCIKDTNDFLQRIHPMDFSNVTVLGSFDVTSLFTCIPHNEGIHCIREELIKNPNLSNREISFILELIELILG